MDVNEDGSAWQARNAQPRKLRELDYTDPHRLRQAIHGGS
jgi:hypothetical protein